MLTMSQQITQALPRQSYPCLGCGREATMYVNKPDEMVSPHQFHIEWYCAHCQEKLNWSGDLPTPDEIVFWSHPHGRQFIADHPRRINEPAAAIEYQGQPSIRFRTVDITSSARLTAIAHRHTLHILALEG